MNSANSIGDPRLAVVYRYWLGKCDGLAMPSPDAIALCQLPKSVQPNSMILDLVEDGGRLRFRYRHVGAVFWRASGREPIGTYVDEVLPTTAGYRDYILGIYHEMATTARPMYTENLFVLRHGQADPMATRRLSLPLAHAGGKVEMVLAAHVFDYGAMGDDAFALVTGLQEGMRVFLDA